MCRLQVDSPCATKRPRTSIDSEGTEAWPWDNQSGSGSTCHHIGAGHRLHLGPVSGDGIFRGGRKPLSLPRQTGTPSVLY